MYENRQKLFELEHQIFFTMQTEEESHLQIKYK